MLSSSTASGYCNGQRRCGLWIPLGITYSVLDHSSIHPSNICWLPALHEVLVIRVQWRKAPLFCSSSWDGGSQREGHFSSVPLHTWLREDNGWGPGRPSLLQEWLTLQWDGEAKDWVTCSWFTQHIRWALGGWQHNSLLLAEAVRRLYSEGWILIWKAEK